MNHLLALVTGFYGIGSGGLTRVGLELLAEGIDVRISIRLCRNWSVWGLMRRIRGL